MVQRDLYAILFLFIMETANHKICPPASQDTIPTAMQIVVLDQPGFQMRGPTTTGSMMLTGTAPLISAYGHNGFDKFCINFADELVESYILHHTFNNAVGYNGHITGDGIILPPVLTMDNTPCVELLCSALLSEHASRKLGGLLGVMAKACTSYKSGKAGEKKAEDMLQDLISKFRAHPLFVASPSQAGMSERNLFGINHYARNCSYDVTSFIEKDMDLLDATFVLLLCHSSNLFISKMVLGPSLAMKNHLKGESITVQAQVCLRPLRQLTLILSPDGSLLLGNDEQPQLDPTKIYSVTTQLNYMLLELFTLLDRT